jgi:hypothetical protein
MASAINQLIAQSQGPDILGSAMRGLAAADQQKAAAQDREMNQQRISLGQRQMAMADQEYAAKRMEQAQKKIANVAVGLDRLSDPAQKNMFYQRALQEAASRGDDVSQFPQQYDEQAKAILDYHKSQVYGGEILKEELGRKPKDLTTLIGKATPESIAAYEQSGNIADLQEVRESISPLDREKLAIDRERLAIEKSRQGGDSKPPAGYRWADNGADLIPIPGGPADAKQGQRNAVPTEGERKAATLYSRLKFSEQQLQDALAGADGAAKPSLLSESVRAIGGDTAANSVTSQERQRVEAAQLDLLDAALTLGTGAAYTKEQLRGYARSYFPQIGDDEKTVADKHARLQNIIGAARISAGRAAEDADAMPGPESGAAGKYSAGQIIEVNGKQYRVIGGDPNDPDVEPL